MKGGSGSSGSSGNELWSIRGDSSTEISRGGDSGGGAGGASGRGCTVERGAGEGRGRGEEGMKLAYTAQQIVHTLGVEPTGGQ